MNANEEQPSDQTHPIIDDPLPTPGATPGAAEETKVIIQSNGGLSTLTSLFLTPKMPKPAPEYKTRIAPALAVKNRDGSVKILPPLVPSPTICQKCGLTSFNGTMRLISQQPKLYAHAQCVSTKEKLDMGSRRNRRPKNRRKDNR